MALNVESDCACICLCLCLCVFVFVLVLWPWHNVDSDCAGDMFGVPRVNMEKLPLTLVFPKTQFPDSDFWIIYESSVYCSHSHIFEIDHIFDHLKYFDTSCPILLSNAFAAHRPFSARRKNQYQRQTSAPDGFSMAMNIYWTLCILLGGCGGGW